MRTDLAAHLGPIKWNLAPLWSVAPRVDNKNLGMVENNLLSLSYGRVIRKPIDAIGGLRPESYETYNIIEHGDVVLRMTDLQNDKRSIRTGQATERGLITSAYITVRPDSAQSDPRFVAAVLRAYDIQKAYYEMGAGVRQNLGYAELIDLPIPLPPKRIQQRIADYLDRETMEIDAMIEKLNSLIAVLHARRESTIAAVWNEGSANGWEIRPLWSMYQRDKVLGFTHEPMVSVFKEHGVVFKADHENLNVTAQDRSIYQLIDPGWLVINRMKAWLGSVGVSGIRGITSGHYICFRPTHDQNHSYLNWMFRSPQARAWFSAYSRGVRPGQAEIDNSYLDSMPILLPPLDQQQRIADHLDEVTSRIDQMLAKVAELKSLLTERRAALITDVVTGRKEVA